MAKIPQLSDVQIECLRELIKGHPLWECSYSLRFSLSTLRSLERRGLVESRGGLKPGSIFMPTTVIEWRITEKGRALIKEIVDERD